MYWFLGVFLIYATSAAHGFHLIGCFVDARSRDLPVFAGGDSMSASKCNSRCTGRSLAYFGLQAGNECWCGNSFGRHGARPPGECQRKCNGDHAVMCGSGWRNSVYASDFDPGFKFIGCYADSGSRDLPVLAAQGSMSVGRCHALCKQRSAAYFGLQHGSECWCGNSYGRYGSKPAQECGMRCSGDHGALCGAGWRNSVYATGLSPLQLPATSDQMQLHLRDQLAAQIRSQFVALPSDAVCSNCLISAWTRRDVDVSSRVFPVKDLNTVLASYPAKVRDKVRVLQFGVNARTTFEDFHINVGGNSAVRKSYIGMARRVNGNVELGMLAANVESQLVIKYNVFHRKTCKTILWIFKKCSTNTIRERRGFHAREIGLIDVALQSETFRLFGEKLFQMTV